MARPTQPIWFSWLCLLAAVLAGAGFWALHVPLAFVLGPMLVTAGFSIGGFKVWAPVNGRRFGQLIIGGAIGLNLTPPVLLNMIGWLPAMIGTALLSMAFSGVLASGLAYFGRFDGKTAFFALMPGGLSEMASIGAGQGAQSEPIALVQALRVALVVCILPPLIGRFGIDGDFVSLADRPDLGPIGIVLLVVASGVGVWLLRLVRFNNPWVVGAILGAAGLAASGQVAGHLPNWLFYLGQFLIGISIGARFRREAVLKLHRVAVVGAVFVVLMTAGLFGFALLLSAWGGIDIASAALASSPGGFAEMAATAQSLHLDVALVTGFHVIRSILVNGLTSYSWTVFHRVGLLRT